MATKLQIYNDCLVLLGEPRLATITDDTQGRYELDNFYDRAVLYVTRQAAWTHALKIVSPASGAAVYQGFAYSYAKPGDWLRTHAIYTISGQRESPVDAREIGSNWAANLNTGVYFRYIASGIAEANWSESFTAALAAYLAFQVAERISGKGEKSETMFQLWQARLAEGASIDAMPDSEWLSAQLDGSFQHAAEFILNQGYWRFAEKVGAIGQSSSTLPGFAFKHLKPADWIKTHSIYDVANSRELPIDVRESAGYWHSNQVSGSIYVRYISRDGLLASLWPESFTKAVKAFLRFEKSRPDGKTTAETWAQSMSIASGDDGQPANEWLEAQLDGSFQRAAEFVLNQGNWRFAQKTIGIASGAAVLTGYSYSHTKPADWVRTQSIFILVGANEQPIDVRENLGKWHSNIASGFNVRYVSTDGLLASTWPESFTKAVKAFLRFERARPDDKGAAETWAQSMQIANSNDAQPDSEWLSAQLDGSFQHAAEFILNQGYWRFAEKVGAIGQSSSTLPGFAFKHLKPADWIKTHSIYDVANSRELPIDVRENAGYWHSNQGSGSINVRYISRDGLVASVWPESFTKAVKAFLRFEKSRPDGKTTAETWAQSMSIASVDDGQPANEWLEAQLDGSFQRAAEFVLNQGNWRFAQKVVEITSSSSTLPGFSEQHLKPTDWLKTHSIFIIADAREQPIDVRENAGYWHSNQSSIYVRYISRDGLLASLWPESFTKAVKAFLRFERNRPDDKGAAETWAQSLDIASIADSQPENEWLAAQLNGSFQRAAEFVLNQGYWRFAQKTSAIVGITGDLSGFAYKHLKPSDWLKTHSIYALIGPREQPIDIRENAGYWHSHLSTINVRYISRAKLLTPATWPESFTKAVRSFIHFEQSTPRNGPHDGPPDKSAVEPWAQSMQAALDADGQPANAWLDFQLDGSMLKAARTIAEDGLWNFAEKRVAPTASTSTVSGYAYRYLKPDDWIRTIDLYEPNGLTDRYDIPWIDDSGYLHTNSGTGVLRYVSSTNIEDTTKWPDQFAAIVLALCNLWRTTANPKASGASVEARRQAYESALREGKAKDNARSRTRINNSGVIVASRYGSFYGEQGRRY